MAELLDRVRLDKLTHVSELLLSSREALGSATQEGEKKKRVLPFRGLTGKPCGTTVCEDSRQRGFRCEASDISVTVYPSRPRPLPGAPLEPRVSCVRVGGPWGLDLAPFCSRTRSGPHLQVPSVHEAPASPHVSLACLTSSGYLQGVSGECSQQSSPIRLPPPPTPARTFLAL